MPLPAREKKREIEKEREREREEGKNDTLFQSLFWFIYGCFVFLFSLTTPPENMTVGDVCILFFWQRRCLSNSNVSGPHARTHAHTLTLTQIHTHTPLISILTCLPCWGRISTVGRQGIIASHSREKNSSNRVMGGWPVLLFFNWLVECHHAQSSCQRNGIPCNHPF